MRGVLVANVAEGDLETFGVFGTCIEVPWYCGAALSHSGHG